jgi:hypothetical protein
MTKTSFQTTLKRTGPFFHGDPSKTFRQNAHDLMEAVAREGAADVRGQLRMGDAGRLPVNGTSRHVSDYVAGELRKAPAGPNYRAVTFVRNRGLSKIRGISLMAAASWVESQVHAFRKSKGRMARSREINSAELLKGLQ